MTIRLAIDLGLPTERGTTVAAYDYTIGAIDHLGIQPVILYNNSKDCRPELLTKFAAVADILPYRSEADRTRLAHSTPTDVLYRLLIQKTERRIPHVYNACHLVFSYATPVGDTSAYVSDWLSDYASGRRLPFVPHIVSLPQPTDTIRPQLGISDDAYLVGRHGGFDQFDIPFVKHAVGHALDRRPDLYFVFVNTEPFVEHKRVVFLPAILDSQDKSNFIASCDAMIHARYRGETFGLAMAEFLSFKKRVFCWGGGYERNHLRLQPRQNDIYWTRSGLVDLLTNAKRSDTLEIQDNTVKGFSPKTVMDKFSAVFLSDQRTAILIPSVQRLKRRVIYQTNTWRDRTLTALMQ